jgi:hypothetical protein
MRYILIAGGLIGLLLGFGWMMDSRWGDSSMIRGGALFVGAAVSFAIGLATCDIVAEIKRMADHAGSPVQAEPNATPRESQDIQNSRAEQDAAAEAER